MRYYIVALIALLLPSAALAEPCTVPPSGIGCLGLSEKAHQDFLGHLFDGCMPSVLTGRPIDQYIKDAKLEPADPDLARSLLQGQPGRVFQQIDQFTPMALTLSGTGVCTVLARDMPKIGTLVSMTEARLTGLGGRFKGQGKTQSPGSDGREITEYRYAADIKGRRYIVVFSVMPGPESSLGNVIVTVAQTADN